MHFLSTFESYKEWCSKHHPQIDSTKCAMVYQFMKSKDDYDRIDGVDLNYVSYIDGKITTEPVERTRRYSNYLLHFGLLLHILKI